MKPVIFVVCFLVFGFSTRGGESYSFEAAEGSRGHGDLNTEVTQKRLDTTAQKGKRVQYSCVLAKHFTSLESFTTITDTSLRETVFVLVSLPQIRLVH